MDVFLIIVILIMAVLLFGVNIYLLALYCHPDDKGWGSSLFCKIIVVIGLTFSWAQVLVLPLDVANAQGEPSGLDIEFLWMFIYMSIVVLVTILIPFAMFMYEDDFDKGAANRFLTAICYSVVTFAVFAAILFITWAFFKIADLPVEIASNSMASWSSSDQISDGPSAGQKNSKETVEIEVSFPIYCMAMLAFIGWFLFAIFGGVGLSALPIDLIKDFFYRPRIRTAAEARNIKEQLRQETQNLIEMGKGIQDQDKDAAVETGFWSSRKAKRKVDSSMKKFKVRVFNLEKEYSIFKLELNYLDHNPLIFAGKLILGMIFSIVSFLWWMHIILFLLADATPFLNDLLTGLKSSGIGFLSTGVFAFFSIYLLWCTTKGTLKLGLRILCFTIHPMKINETWMNSFLFNIQLILLSSVAVTQFCTKAFSQYARLTDIDLMFNQQIKHLRFFTFFNDNNIFEYTLVIWSAIVAIFLSFTAHKRDGVFKEIDALRKQKFKA